MLESWDNELDLACRCLHGMIVFVGNGRDGGNLQLLVSHREWQLLHNGSALYPGSSGYIETACKRRVTSLINVLAVEHLRSPQRTTQIFV